MEDNKKDKQEKARLERRRGSDRRSGKLDEKYRYSVEAGFFLDMRRGERRKTIPEDTLISLN